MVCSATKDQTTVLQEAFKPSLDEALEYIGDDELVEVSLQMLIVLTHFRCHSVAAHHQIQSQVQSDSQRSGQSSSPSLLACRSIKSDL